MRKARWVCLLIVVCFVFSSGCGNPTILQSITISPSSVDFVGLVSGATAQFTAYGSFIHPTETRDVTTQVTWTSAIPDVATVDSSGLVRTTGFACGSTVITATASRSLVGDGSGSAVVTATAMVHVSEPGNPNCP